MTALFTAADLPYTPEIADAPGRYLARAVRNAEGRLRSMAQRPSP